ncbi:MAG: HAD-IIB family hydrolase [Candidatus Microsaccharimonas sp.]
MKKVLAFDLDDTLAIAKSSISERMSETLSRVLEHFDVCVISGGNFHQFKVQIIDHLDVTPTKLARLHLMPTCGTQYYRFDELSRDWVQQYAENLTNDQKKKIFEVLEASARELGLWPNNPTGDIIEDRESQVTFSALGQKASSDMKYAWDPDGSKKLAIRNLAAKNLEGFEVRTGGTTSIDVTQEGIDKAYGIQKLIDATGVKKGDILFFGDKLQEGGNDYPVKAMGIDSLEVVEWEDTANRLESILAVIK